MQNLILCDNIYGDIDTLKTLMSTMEFIDCLNGQEIENFNYIPAELTQLFSALLKTDIEIQPNTGLFRKPNTIVYFDQFYQHALWSCIVALEDTKLITYQHKDGYGSYFDLPEDIDKDQFFIDNCMNKDNWIVESNINIKKNDFVLIRPWLWKSLEQDKLVQVFMLNTKMENK